MSPGSESKITVYDLVWVVLAAASMAFQLYVLQATPLDLSPDEAHYWEWSRRLDWAYYSKGPIIALLISAGTMLFGDIEFAVRLPAVVLSNLMLVAAYIFIRRWYSAKLAFWCWLSLRTMVVFVSHGFAMTTDPATALAWILAIAAGRAAVERDEPAWWLLACLAIGFGGLCKYTVFGLYPSFAALLVLTPGLRGHLISRGFWAGTLCLGMCVLPVVWWNSQNGWVNLAHNAGHLSARSGFSINLSYLPELIAGQMGLAGPVFFLACVYALYRSFIFWRRGDWIAGLYVWSSLPLAALCVGVSLMRRVYANWPMPIYIGGTFAIAHLVYLYAITPGRAVYWARWSVAINSCITALAFCLVLGVLPNAPGKILPTKKLVGWSELGKAVDQERVRLEARDPNDIPVIAADYGTASAIAFYAQTRPNVFCAVVGSRRMNQYDLWGGWEELKGLDALVVLKNDEHKEAFERMFASMTPIGKHPNLEVFHHSTKIRDFQFYLGRDYQGGVPQQPSRR